MSSLRSGMVTVTLMVGVGLAAAAHTSLGSRASIDDTDASLMDETTGSVGPRKHPELPLSDEQRGRIYEGVMRIADATDSCPSLRSRSRRVCPCITGITKNRNPCASPES